MGETEDNSLRQQAELALRQARWAERSRLPDKAVEEYRKVIGIRPDDHGAHAGLARLLLRLNRPAEALVAARSAHALDPADPQANLHLGQALLHCHQPEPAIAHLQAALAAQPDNHGLRRLLADTLLELGQRDDAAALFDAIDPDTQSDIGLLTAMGRFYRRARLAGSAERCLARAVQLGPRQAASYNELAQLYNEYTEFTRAKNVALAGLAVQPDAAPLWNTLAGCQVSIGQIDDAIASYRKSLQYSPGAALVYSNMLLVMHYSSAITPAALAEEHRRWGRLYAPPKLASTTFGNVPAPGRRIRVGYLSPDFRSHPVAFFVEPLMEHHDRNAFEVFGYGDVRTPTEVTYRLRDRMDHYRGVAGLHDAQLIDVIRRDGIDILVDLAGHAGNDRIVALAYKPAPVQVTYCGYPDSSGIQAVDYRITDALADPPGADANYTERLVRLPGCFLCFRPPADAPEPGPPPALTRGHVTFGSFNRECKISQHCYDVWSRVLHAVPGSRIVLKSIAGHNPETRAYQFGEFARRGIGPERVQILGFVGEQRGHLATYLDVDIALDTFPYNGTTTTLDSLLMGVPVIALEGLHHAGRVGVSLLENIGLPEFVAHSDEEYVDLAVTLASDPARLLELHRTLRQRLVTSPICDERAFTAKFELALRNMWQEWCRSVTPPAGEATTPVPGRD